MRRSILNSFKSSGKPATVKKLRQSLGIEPLEPRVFLSGDPGSTPGTAKDIGAVAVSASLHASDTLSPTDTVDMYKFSIASSRDVTVTIAGLGGYANVELIQDYNNNGLIDNGDVLLQSYNTNSSVAVHQRLPAGTYYAAVIFDDSKTIGYSLTVAAPAAPVDPGNTPGSARALERFPPAGP